KWLADKETGLPSGFCLLVHTTPQCYDLAGAPERRLSIDRLLCYVKPCKSLLYQLALGLLAGITFQLIFTFLTQAVVDIGIRNRNINFIYLILFAQIMLFIGRTAVQFIRSWILLHMSTRINIYILSNFLIKLMKLPMQYFDSRMTGDIMQRM